MHALTVFSWGYWGWGNATAELITAVDAVEAARGFAPPIFVDVRIRRSGRAKGFIADAFEKRLGPKRYRHIAGLGNRNVAEGIQSGITIDRPSDVAHLLALAQEAQLANARVIYFCSCRFPDDKDSHPCHRTEVAKLLMEHASRAGIALTSTEWPGGEPQEVRLQVPPLELRAALAGRKSLPILKRLTLAHAAGLAEGSWLELFAGDRRQVFGTGPALFTGGKWCLPLHEQISPQATPSQWSSRWRRNHGVIPRPNALANAATIAPSPLCIYSIAKGDSLAHVAKAGGSGTLAGGRAWVTGQRHFKESQREHRELRLLLGDATDCSRILYRAIVREIAIEGAETRVAFSGLRALDGRRTPQDLVLASTGRHIAPVFIRPYAICKTPKWLAD